MSFSRRSTRSVASTPVFSTNQARLPDKTFNQNAPNQRQYQYQNQGPQQQEQQFQQQQQQAPQQQQQQQQPQQQQQQPPQQQQQQPPQQQQQPSSIMPMTNPPPPPVIKEDPSATTKALAQMDVDENGRKKWKKGQGVDSFGYTSDEYIHHLQSGPDRKMPKEPFAKLPLAVRRKRMNTRLSKILSPKSALILLHEFKPGCSYKVQEQQGSSPPIFVATVEHESVVLASGQGMSKAQAKNVAAENAIKSFVSQAMKKSEENKGADGFGEDVDMEDPDADSKDPTRNLPWAGLASFAIYKMFAEWQNQGADVSLTRPTPSKPKKKNQEKAPVQKKELPPNASELHPSALLNSMRPGIIAVEVTRTPGPYGNVTMGYEIEGQMYTGTSTSKKDARREAAKAVITALYGLTYN